MSVIHYEMSDNFHFWAFSIPEKIMSFVKCEEQNHVKH